MTLVQKTAFSLCLVPSPWPASGAGFPCSFLVCSGNLVDSYESIDDALQLGSYSLHLTVYGLHLTVSDPMIGLSLSFRPKA